MTSMTNLQDLMPPDLLDLMTPGLDLMAPNLSYDISLLKYIL